MEESKGKQHTPEEMMAVVNEVMTLMQRIQADIEQLASIPEVLTKMGVKEAEFKERVKTLTQEAIAHKRDNDTKASLLALKKKKLVEAEIPKLAEKKAVLGQQQIKLAGILLRPRNRIAA